MALHSAPAAPAAFAAAPATAAPAAAAPPPPPRPPPPPPLRALLICPGRGSYNSSELGSLGRLARPEAWTSIVAEADARCAAAGLEPISALDALPQFSRATHLEAALTLTPTLIVTLTLTLTLILT